MSIPLSVHDLGSTSGTKVNGVAVQNWALKDGDTLNFGTVQATFSARATGSIKQETPKPPEESGWKRAKALGVLFASQLKSFGAALWGEARRVYKLTGLKTKLAKLKSMDLKAAHYALGKKCYELALEREKVATEFVAIAEQDKQILSRQAGASAQGQETKAEQLFALGGAAAVERRSEVALAELERVKLVQRQIAKSEDEHNALGKNNKGAPIHPARYWAVVAVIVILLTFFVIRDSGKLSGVVGQIPEDVTPIGDSGRLSAVFGELSAEVKANQLESADQIYQDAVGHLNKIFCVEASIVPSGNYGFAYANKEAEYLSFGIRTGEKHTIHAFMLRKYSEPMSDEIVKAEGKQRHGFFVFTIKPYKPAYGEPVYKNDVYDYVNCDLLACGPSLNAINADVRRRQVIPHTGQASPSNVVEKKNSDAHGVLQNKYNYGWSPSMPVTEKEYVASINELIGKPDYMATGKVGATISERDAISIVKGMLESREFKGRRNPNP